VVANPGIGQRSAPAIERAVRRVALLGDGWLTCCRARHPEEVERFATALAKQTERPLELAYQVTMTLGDTDAEAKTSQRAYVDAYYPGFADTVDLGDWGPAGTAETVAAWLEEFQAAGVTTAICRFAALDQVDQVERFAAEVMSARASR
jgi:alkanesulfonate monooxygenase SsuD/methylene tetrahydromethanopterin reductase-like flavin-dependent oxidoreductase (luciferase family)